MVKSLSTLLLGTAMALGTVGCFHIEFGKKENSNYRFGAEPQYYSIQEIKTDFKTPPIDDRMNYSFYLGAEGGVNLTERTKLKLGLDARVNLDGTDNRISGGPKGGDCVTHSPFTMVYQDYLTGIPFVGLEQKIDDSTLVLELGFPYTTWNVVAADTIGTTCVENEERAEATGFGQRVRLGVKDLGKKNDIGFYLIYERHRTEIIDVDVYSLQVGIRF